MPRYFVQFTRLFRAQSGELGNCCFLLWLSSQMHGTLQQKRKMESCSHKSQSNSKDCCICRVKRVVNIDQKHLYRRIVKRHQSQEVLQSRNNKQPQISVPKQQKNGYLSRYLFTQTHYDRWIRKIQQKRLKTLPRRRADRPQIDESLFSIQKHRPRFDRWQSKLLNKMAEKGKADLLLRNMCLF